MDRDPLHSRGTLRENDPVEVSAIDPSVRVVVDGKFLRAGESRMRVKGVAYGTFAPDADGVQYPDADRIASDFAAMSALGVNAVRVYSPPPPALLDLAAGQGLRLMIGLPWVQHTAFLDDRSGARAIRRGLVERVRELAPHPASMLFALGNEIPAAIVRWHGRARIERFLHDLYDEARDAAPDSLFTYVNFPPTEHLDLPFLDVCSFNVYLHHEPELRAYLARLQNIAGNRPLLLAEAGADSIREGEDGQAAITSMHLRAAFEEGACGAIAYSWTDDWWRGGAPVDDWAFGLVDRDRAPKPAAAAVATAFGDAPFAPGARAGWPRVSVVVCAYNAADTIGDCLDSLTSADYPDFEVILVDDGSRDRTVEIAREHAGVRVIEAEHRGLAAARNVGIAEATGEIVAYIDADVRVDPDWLGFLVQPLLGAPEVVGSGGPNVVPGDDPAMAQCVARAPGGPTHVLLEDRVAEHVPGCNMAFRRDALVEIGGFDPIYVRAGDDVDLCWRLQARGWTVGFAPAALVWHHHRTTARAFWRQQVGYGEGETFLLAHHPEKFLEGRMLWHGRIYSPLPFVRSLERSRANTGVWGTAAFPSVYRTDANPLAHLPHSLRWLAGSIAMIAGGVVSGVASGPGWTTVALLVVGLAGVATTVGRNLAYGLRSDVHGVPGSPLRNRLTIAWLHLIQPLARGWGRLLGTLTPAEVAQPRPAAPALPARIPALADLGLATRLLSGGTVEAGFWSERWISNVDVLDRLIDRLRRARPSRACVVDDGWSHDRDVSALIGRWAWLDVRALVEEHDRGRCAVRIATSLRPTGFGIAAMTAFGLTLAAMATSGLLLARPLIGGAAALATLVGSALAIAGTAAAEAAVRGAVQGVADATGMVPLSSGQHERPPLPAPSPLRVFGLRAASVLVVAILLVGGATLLFRDAARADTAATTSLDPVGPAMSIWLDTPGGIAIAPDGDIFVSDTYDGVIRRIDERTLAALPHAGSAELGSGFSGDGGPADKARLDEPKGIAIAPDGALLIADSYNNRVRRVDPVTGVIRTVAGSGVAGFGGDDGPALEAALHAPSAVAVGADGAIYIADTLNNRVRRIDPVSGAISTVAGNGQVSEVEPVGDGGPATAARLYMPSDVAVAANSDLYIADMHHNRVRRVDASSGTIGTVAGNGSFANSADGVMATESGLAGPAGIALMQGAGDAPVLFIADSYNGVIRRVDPDGVMRIVGGGSDAGLGTPSRVAYDRRRGLLYVGDPLADRLVAVTVRSGDGQPTRVGATTGSPDRGGGSR